MNRTEKTFSSTAKKADAKKDIAIINQFSVTELKPDDVYCFSVILCDNEVDRDMERFTDATLEQLAKLFVGKTGIMDHQWSTKNQIARLYRVEVEAPGGMNTMGQPLKRLRGSAYMPRNENTAPIISLIGAGIMKEVSVGVSIGSCNCSICGNPLMLDLDTFKYRCANDHVKGEKTSSGELCVGNLENPMDAYEFSFVAVPAQPGAGVTKAAQKIGSVSGMTAEELEKRRQIYQYGKSITNETARPVTAKQEMPNRFSLAPSPGTQSGCGCARFSIIPDSCIYSGDREAAEKALAFARKDLGLPPVAIRWFVPEMVADKQYGVKDGYIFENVSNLLGTIDTKTDDVIYIRAYDATVSQIEKTALHEAYHIMQFQADYFASRELMEHRADEYAKEAMRRMNDMDPKELEDLYLCHMADIG